MKNRRLVIIVLLAIIFATGLYAQRDSLCMAEIDMWYNPDSTIARFYSMVGNGDYIYGTLNEKLYVFHLSDSGSISLDTILIFSDRLSFISPIYQDTLTFLNKSRDIILLDVSNPAKPESVFTYTELASAWSSQVIARDSVLYLIHYDIYRYDISNPLEISIIPTYLPWLLLGPGGTFSYPYVYSSPLFSLDGYSDLRVYDVTVSDTLIMYLYRDILRSSEMAVGGSMLSARDTLIFSPEMEGIVRTYRFSSALDTVIQIHNTGRTGFERTENRSYLHDSLLIVSWFEGALDITPAIHIFNVADPHNVQRIGYHISDTENEEYGWFAMRDSFLVVAFRYGLKVFKITCLESVSENALAIAPNQLQLEVYPNPFNSTCKIGFTLEGYEKPVLSIFNLQGRKVLDKSLELSQSSYLWDASGEASGVYIVVLRQGDNTTTKLVMLLK